MIRRAFTLIEMLVSLAITLIMMGAVTTLFGLITDNVSGARAGIEMADRLRACRNRLQADLQAVTVGTMQPPLRPENDEGYFEYIEGINYDKAFVTGGNLSPLGDCDDVLMFTVRSRGEPFVGKLNGTGTVESQVAEVMYFAVPNGPILDATTPGNPTQLYTLYRRVLLVLPGLRVTNPGLFSPLSPTTQAFYDLNDVSVHVESPTGGPLLVPNTLGDLTKPECRFAHYGSSDLFPFPLNRNSPNRTGPLTNRPIGNNAFLVPFINTAFANRVGDDVLMTNVLAFDVQVYDPNAPVSITSNVAVTPTDAGAAGAQVASGAFVDLGSTYIGSTTPLFNATVRRTVTGTLSPSPLLPMNKWSQLVSGVLLNPPPTNTNDGSSSFTYDTWSLHYENDGVLQNSNPSYQDLASNGLDDAGPGGAADGIVDNLPECETLAPFAAKIRGIRVIVRAYEPSSQQVREITVVQDFLPE